MKHDILTMLFTGGLFGLLFAVAELLHFRFRLPAETTRKITHLGTGLLTMRFLYFRHIWQAGLLCGLFFIILLWSKRQHSLSSINGISRKSYGSILYPVAVFLVFIFSRSMGESYYFALPVLVLAICDPAAAIAGRWYKNRAGITGERKTWAGTAAFIIAGALIVFAINRLYGGWQPLPTVYIMPAIIIAAIAERLSKNGWDNFTLPISMMAYFRLATELHELLTQSYN